MDNCTIVHESHNTKFTIQYSALYCPLGISKNVLCFHRTDKFEGFKTQVECDFLCAGHSSMNVQQISMEVQESMQNKGNYVFNGFITHCDYV